MNAPTNFVERTALDRATHDPYAQFVTNAIRVTNPNEFVALVKHDLQPIFPNGMFLAGIGYATHEGIEVEHAVGISYPPEYINKLKRQRIWAGPILGHWLKTNRPQLFDPHSSAFPVPAAWVNAFRRHDLRNIAAHGVKDLKSHGASYFTFSQIPGPLTENHAELLDMLVPMLHQALVRATQHNLPVTSSPKSNRSSLTEREVEVMGWLAVGKTAGEIASILGSSQHTVKNQVRAILQKLDVENRVQAIAKATRLGVMFPIAKS